MGACVGDVFGAYLKYEDKILPSELEKAMTMPGGGPFALGKGQGTDNTELVMCLIRGLLAGDGKLDLDAVAEFYARWMLSDPFSSGITINRALRPLTENRPSADVCIEAAERFNSSSQSPGSLVRATAIAVWAHRLNPPQIAKAARLEASMTHSNPTVQHANACYVLAICHLINHPGDSPGAFQAARDYANEEGDDDIRDWFRFISSGAKMPGVPQTGWAKIAFTHAFEHLLGESGYEEAIRETIALGGDPDTNATIVGGLIGAARGIEGIPEEFVEKVTGYTSDTFKGKRREELLNQTEVLQQVAQLYALAPSISSVVIGSVEQAL